MRLVITCGCGDTTQFARDAFRIMFPKEELPHIVEMNDNNKVLFEFMFSLLNSYLVNTDTREPANHKVFDIESKFAYYIDSTPVMRCDIDGEWYNEVDMKIADLRKGHMLC